MNIFSIFISTQDKVLLYSERVVSDTDQNINFQLNILSLEQGNEVEVTIDEQGEISNIASYQSTEGQQVKLMASSALKNSQRVNLNYLKSESNFVVIIDVEGMRQEEFKSRSGEVKEFSPIQKVDCSSGPESASKAKTIILSLEREELEEKEALKLQIKQLVVATELEPAI